MRSGMASSVTRPEPHSRTEAPGTRAVLLACSRRARAVAPRSGDSHHRVSESVEAFVDGHRKPGANLIDMLRLANVEFDRATALEPNFSFAYFAETDLYEHILLADDQSPAERLDAQRMALKTLQQ